MIRPALVLEKLQRAVDEARGSRWRPSCYVSIAADDDMRWEGLKTPRTKGLIDAAFGAGTLLILAFFFLLNTDGTTTPVIQSLNTPEFEMFNLLGDFNGSAIKDMCEHKRFQPGLYFQCDESDGGIGNIRNAILLCTRYAVETGAQLVTPHIHLRSTSNLAELHGNIINMTYLFDYDEYKRRIEDSCPGFKIYETIDDIPEEVPLAVPNDLYDPVDLHWHGGMINTHILDHRVETREWIFKQLGIHPTKQTPILVRLKRALFGWHYGEDQYDVWLQWSKLLPYQAITYELAAEVLKLMATDLNDPELHAPMIMRHGYRFVGQHLRTEGDASVEMKEYGFDPQMNAAIVTCKEYNITDLYIASGDAGEAAKAVARGLEHGIAVHTKYSIMENHPALQKAIVEMTFDQQALIDYLILLKSTQFVGVDSSSFSGNLVVTRHASLPGETPWTGFRDELSFLLGDRYEWLRDGMWA